MVGNNIYSFGLYTDSVTILNRYQTGVNVVQTTGTLIADAVQFLSDPGVQATPMRRRTSTANGSLHC